jgi:uracil-DNA glycosylase family 4
MNPDHHKAARELLAFYREAGVDAPLGETPVDRFADPGFAEAGAAPELRGAPDTATGQRPGGQNAGDLRRPPPPAPVMRQPPSGAVPPSAEAAVMAARDAARSAVSLEELRDILDRFEGCALKSTATRLVFADGNPQSRIMFVGEAPGRDEDIEGLPFVGRSGKLLDRMMAAIGLDRSSVYIANIIPWRPPGNRTPTPQESEICLPFILRQIELSAAEVVVTLGNPSTQTLLAVKDGITKTRGRWFTLRAGTRELRAMPTFHPAFLLRQPLSKRQAWRDFLAIEKALAAGTPRA